MESVLGTARILPKDLPSTRPTRTVHGRGGSSNNHNKEWNPEFFTRRSYLEERPFVQLLREYQADGDNLDRFMVPCEGRVPSYKLEVVKKFCAGAWTPGKAKAWLDDREFSTQRSRTYPYRLTADQLHTSLTQKRFGRTDLPDAERRLIYIPDLNRHDIWALTETASCHQADTLRDAIYKHLTLQTSIRVKIPPMGFSIFRLEFHIPYPAFRELTTFPESHLQSGVSNKRRTWRNLSFLRKPSSNPLGHTTIPSICDAHISLAVCGSDHQRWVCYAFADTDFKTGNDDDEQDEDETNEDPIASDGDGDPVMADTPIWDPREYFLRNLDFRMRQVLEEWTYVIHIIEDSVERYIEAHPPTLFGCAAQDRLRYFDAEFIWIAQTIDLLGHLRRRASQTVKAWDRFEALNGDLCYFSDVLEQPHITNGIRESFEELNDIKQTLVHLDQFFCERQSKILELSMSLESNRQNLEGYKVSLETSQAALANQRTAQLGISLNLFSNSLTIAVALFAIQPDALQFNRSPKSLLFIIFGMLLLFLLFVRVSTIARHITWPIMPHMVPMSRLKSMLPANKRVISSNTHDDIELNRLPTMNQPIPRCDTV